MLPRLSSVCVRVSDMARSVAFYQRTLGLRLRFDASNWIEFETGAVRFALYGGGRPHREPRFTGVAFQVENLAAAVATLQEQGVECPRVWEDDADYLATFLDPDRNLLFLHQPKPGPGCAGVAGPVQQDQS